MWSQDQPHGFHWTILLSCIYHACVDAIEQIQGGFINGPTTEYKPLYLFLDINVLKCYYVQGT